MGSVGQLGIYACDFLGVCDFVVIAGETRVVRVFIYFTKLLSSRNDLDNIPCAVLLRFFSCHSLPWDCVY